MKKPFLIKLIVLLLIVTAIIISFYFFQKSRTVVVKENDPETEKLVTISQAEMSSFIFVTQESESNHILNINLTPFLTFIVDEKEIKSFEISNFKGTNSKSEVVLIPPTGLSLETLSRTFLFTTQDTINQEDLILVSKNIEYLVVKEATKFNEVNTMGIVTPYFGIIIKDIGRVNFKEIMDRDGTFDGGKYLEYSKVPYESLDTEIQFDINIEFTDGEIYNKRFKALLNGESFSTEASPMTKLETVE